MILALGENGALGQKGKLPWSRPYPEDRAYFDRTTHDHVVVMGRRTWEEEGVPLPGRRGNIVVSRDERFNVAPPAILKRSLEEALTTAWREDPNPFVIGGAALFHAALPRITTIHLTEIPESPAAADVFFTFDRLPFDLTSEIRTESGLRFLIFQRRNPLEP